MSALLAAPLLLALLTATSASDEWDTSGARPLELTAENAKEAHPVRIRPGQPTNLVFNAPLQPGGVEVEGEQWVAVAVNEKLGLVMLLPSGEPPPDEPVRVTVRFEDGQAPERATFRLVVHSTRAEHHVRVSRQVRACESHAREALRQRERAERCETALERMCTGPEGPRPGGLMDLFDAGLMGEGKGLLARDLQEDITQRPGETLKVVKAWSYRVERRGHVAVELEVVNTGLRPWTAEGVDGAELVSPRGVRPRVVRVWQPEPLGPGEEARLVVEAEGAEGLAQGTFLLKLGEAGGPRTLTVRGVLFP